MTVNGLYRHFLNELDKIYERPEAASITSLVFENIAGIVKSGMIKDPERLLDIVTLDKLNAALDALKKHEPVQYILGEAWFYKMKLKVSPAVLIPRPETEELAVSVISYLKGKPATLLDIGTGSGCIAITIKKNLPQANITAIDISHEALMIAKENSIQQQTDITFRELDFLNESLWDALPVFDLIVSNPPYIPITEKHSLDKNVAAFEPPLALFVEDNRPLIFYEKIAVFGRTHLKAGGKIFMETHESFAKETAAIFIDDVYSAETVRDINGKERMVIATRHSR